MANITESSQKDIAMDFHQKFVDHEFHNWLKGALGVNLLRHGIEELILKNIETFQQNLLDDIKKQSKNIGCNCTIENVLPCPTKNICIKKTGLCSLHCSSEKQYRPCPEHICDKIRDTIRKYHRYNCPSWVNTHSEEWCTNVWEIAKCYMPPGAYAAVKSVTETDFNGLLSVLVNHTMFKNKIDETSCIETRENVNKIRHSSDLCMTTDTLNSCFKVFTDFLSKISMPDERFKDTLRQLNELKTSSLPISNSDITKVIEDVIKEITRRSLEDIEHAKEQAKLKYLEEVKLVFQEEKSSLHKSLSDFFNTKALDIEQRARCSAHIRETPKGRVYRELKANMKEDLLEFNKIQHGTLPYIPLCMKSDEDLLDFYVKPTLNCIEHRSAFGQQRSETKTPLKCFHDIFFKNSHRLKEIYLISDAGLGKTAFGKWLTIAWCHAHSPTKTDESKFFDDILSLMKKFEFVFFVPLRDSYKLECDIDTMILKGICYQLSRSSVYKIEVLQEILHREDSLIILDGVDEWAHSDQNITCPGRNVYIPHRKIRKNCTILTTTRPCKFKRTQLKCNQIDQCIELTGLTKHSSRKLVEKVVPKLNTYCCNDELQCIEGFNAEIKNKKIDELQSIPLLLTHLICLWCDEHTLGQTRCEIFCNFIVLILSRADKISGDFADECDINTTIKVKKVFKLEMFSKKYHKLLFELSRLAFEALFDENRECSLVFENEVVERYMEKENVAFCLKVGLLVQHKIACKVTTNASKTSFRHKTFQEFFSALYIETLQDPSEVIHRIITVCKTDRTILNLSNVFCFMSGLCPQTLSTLSHKMEHIIAEDEITQKYRISACSLSYWSDLDTIKSLQNMFVACVDEFFNTTEFKRQQISLYMEDFILDGNCRIGNYGSKLKYLFKNNKKQTKSIHINDVQSSSDFHEIIQAYEVNDLKDLEKLDLWVVMEENQLDDILTSSVSTLKHLLLHTGHWNENRWTENYTKISDNSLCAIQNMFQLETISLWDLVLTHVQLENLLKDISKKNEMKQIGLGDIKCLDHGSSCRGYDLDLSKHDGLSNLQINEVPLASLKTSTSSLQESYIGSFSNSSVLLSLLECLKSPPKFHTFGCFSLYAHSDVKNVLSTIPSMITLRRLLLNRMDLGKEFLSISQNATALELIKLKRVKISGEALLTLVKEIENHFSRLTVELVACEIAPPVEVSKIKDHICSSEKIQLIQDSVDQFRRHLLTFRCLSNDV